MDCTRLEEFDIPEDVGLHFIYEETEHPEDVAVLYFGIHSFCMPRGLLRSGENTISVKEYY